MAVDGKDLVEKIGGVNQAGKEDKTEELLRGPLPKPISRGAGRRHGGGRCV